VHDPQDARARHVAEPDAAVRLGDARAAFMVIFAMPAVMVASTCLLMDRLVGTHFFNPRRRRPAPLAAPVLVLRPSRGLHHLDPALGIVSTIVDLRAPAVFGYAAWCCRCRHGDSSASACGSTTCSRPAAAARAELLHRRQHDDRDAQRRADLLLAGHALVGAAASRTPLLYALGFVAISCSAGSPG
jgi:hypothetical protein